MSRLLAVLVGLTLVIAACSDSSDTVDGSSTDQTSTGATVEETSEDEAADDGMADEPASDEGTADETSDEDVADDVAADETVADDPDADPCLDLATGNTAFQLNAGGANHDVQIFVPSSFDGTPKPAVLNWHGLGSNGPEQAGFSDYETLAEKEGFIAVHATGVPAPGDDRNSWELPQFDEPNRNDVSFARELIDELIASYCVDAKRVYSTGMSNGGFFTSVLVCKLADKIAAASSIAGTTHTDSCEPSRPVPYLSFHGTADAVVKFEGGGSVLLPADADDAMLEFFDQVMPIEFAEFATDFNCAAEPDIAKVAEDVTRYDYVGCDDGVQLSFYEVAEGTHTWPGSPAGPLLGGYTTTSIDATALSWELFKQYSLE